VVPHGRRGGGRACGASTAIGRCSVAMPRGRSEQGRPVADRWAWGHSDGGGGSTV
jgi:hypothetical protein